MPDYFLGLAISSIIGLLVGIVRPALIGNKKRAFYLKLFTIIFFVSAIIFGITESGSSNALLGLLGVFTVPIYIIRNLKIKKKENIKSKVANNSATKLNLITEPKNDVQVKKSNISYTLSNKKLDDVITNYPIPLREPGTFDWYIMISFGKSTSQNYDKAVYLAKQSNKYGEQVDDGIITHTATYDDSRESFLDFIILYDIVSNWKSTVFIINGELVDRKTVGRIKYCYGDKCRSVKSDFCFGASYMTANPFGCHRLQVSLANNPWWKYYIPEKNHYRFDIDSLLERIDRTEAAFKYCPAFNIDYIKEVAESFPLILTKTQYDYVLKKANQIYFNY